VNPWYRQPVSSPEFKAGLKGSTLKQLKSLKAVFTLEQRQGKKVIPGLWQ
jgi:hypothetical protein